MAVVKCNSGHFYDASKYDECPHCKEGVRHIKKESYADDMDQLITNRIRMDDQSRRELWEEKTVGEYSFSNGTQLLVGWLVCTQGNARGRDYKLYHGWNRIGRDPDMNIFIQDDPKISEREHAAVVFDKKTMKFHIVNQFATETYLNGQLVKDAQFLNDGDVIQMGDSEFTFIVFCTEERKWEKE